MFSPFLGERRMGAGTGAERAPVQASRKYQLTGVPTRPDQPSTVLQEAGAGTITPQPSREHQYRGTEETV
jgi:hypothetical protein